MSETQKELRVIDNAIPEELLQKCIFLAESSKSYSVLHRAGDGTFGFKYSWYLYTPEEQKEIEFPHSEFMELWNVIKQHLPENSKLYASYINAHTYGVEDCIHVDGPLDASERKNKGYTIVIYLCNDWYAEWFGQTLFFNEYDKHSNEIGFSAMPKRNRFVIFDSDIPHCVSPLSRRFAGVRLTYMFKVEIE